MKKNIPYFAGGAAAATMSGDDAELTNQSNSKCSI